MTVVDTVLVAGSLKGGFTGRDGDVVELDDSISFMYWFGSNVSLTVSVNSALWRTGAGADLGRAVAKEANATTLRISMIRPMLIMIEVLWRGYGVLWDVWNVEMRMKMLE